MMLKLSRGRGMLLAFVPAMSFGLIGCDSLPPRLPRDPPGTALNASSSIWRGLSSTGATSVVRQVSTAENRFSFQETWYQGKGKGLITTRGVGDYEPRTKINIYRYSEPPGVVVVRTVETKEDLAAEDTVLASTLPIFQVGEKITYNLLR